MNSLARNSLKQTLRSSWIVLASVGLLVSALAFLLVSYLDFKKSYERIQDDLKIKSVVIDRRVSAEQLGGNRTVTENVIQDLVRWYDLKVIEEVQGVVPCPDFVSCIKQEGSTVVSYRKLSESLTGDSYLKVSASFPNFWASLRLSYLFSVFTPILGLFIIGIYLQRRILNRSLIYPINHLIRNSYQGDDPPNDWPTELADLSHRLEKAFQERDQAMIGQLASGVLHDIKTYLHSVSLATDLASEKKGTEKYQVRLESLHNVCSQQVPKMKAIVDSVLDGSREIKVNAKDTSLEQLLRSSISNLQSLADQSNVAIEVEVQADVVAQVDAVQFDRAVSNLLKNAIEAAAETEVKESAKLAMIRSVKVSSREENGAVYLSVEDSGSGLPSNSNKLFERVKTTKTHGTGLGLLVTKKIIEAHRGSISADKSESLGGARFTVKVPLKSSEEGLS